MYYVCRHFDIREFVPEDVYKLFGTGSSIVMDHRILWTMDAIRDDIGSAITVNNWHRSGPFSQRGFRRSPVVAQFSQHMFGRACDFDIKGMDSETFRLNVKAGKYRKALKYITRIEDGVSWNHVDCADIQLNKGELIRFFKA